MLQFEENNIHNWWFIIESMKIYGFSKKKSSDYWRQRCVFIDEEYFMRLLSQCNVAVLFKKIIYIIEEGQERMREKKEQKKKRREQSVYKWSVKNREQLMIMIFLHSRPCQIFAIESLNSLETLEQHVPK